MKESTKRIIDCLALLALGLPAAIIWFDCTNNQHASIWIVLLIFDLPFAIAAFFWLGWRLLSVFPKGERTKRVIDWLTLIPFGFWPAMIVWADYAHYDHPSAIWIALLVVNIPFVVASVTWLGVRRDKIRIIHWFIYNIAMFPGRRILFIFACLAIALLIRSLWR
jgi:uncharacterized membrane-anchored protein YitT (DUF2179 family)